MEIKKLIYPFGNLVRALEVEAEVASIEDVTEEGSGFRTFEARNEDGIPICTVHVTICEVYYA